MRMVTARFPIVVYPSEFEDIGRLTAHCLNLDLVADDNTLEGALTKLLETIEVQLDAAEQYHADPFRSAPQKYWDILALAKPVPRELTERIVEETNRRHKGAQSKIEPSQIEIRNLEMANT